MAIIREDIPIKSTPTKTNTTAPTTSVGDSGISEKKNKGSLLGGIGYLGEKLAVGTVQSIEGISDYAIGGIAKLFGFDKFAERQFRNDWFGDWYTHPDEWFNAGKGWKVAGDVFGGIGTSLPAILAATGVTIATGGVGAGAGAAILAKSGAIAGASFLTAGLGAAGNATKEAYQDTGKLTGKEFGYGALTGTLEGTLEGVTNVIGMGSGAVVKSIAKNFSKEAFESAVRQGVGITLAKSFAGEAFEEGVAEIMSAPFKRMTYDKNAENATGSQIAYASIIGGLSGVVMGGAGSVFNAAQNTARGTQIVEKGQTEQVLELAKAINDKADAENLGDIKQFKQVEATYKKLTTSLAKTGGEVKTVAQRRMLGELKIDNVSAVFAPKMFNEAARIVNSADLIAKTYKGVDANGQPISYTKEQILEGVDLDNLRGTIPTALETNEALRNVVMSSMVGEMLMDTSAFQQAILNGERFAGEADLENFRKEAPDEQKREVEKVLGIDNIDTVDSATFNEKQKAFINSPRYEEFFNLNQQMKARASQPIEETLSNEQSITTDTAQAPVENIAKPLDNDTGIRYAKGMQTDEFATYSMIWAHSDKTLIGERKFFHRRGEWVLLEKVKNGTIELGVYSSSRRKLIVEEIKEHNERVHEEFHSCAERVRFAKGYDNGNNRNALGTERKNGNASGLHRGKIRNSDRTGDNRESLRTGENITSSTTYSPTKSMSVVESIKFAQDNVPEYSSLDSEGQARVRRLIRQAKANGFTDAETRAYARVAARSGIDIVIDKEGLYLGKDKNTRADVYADGLYSPRRNKILVNPEGTRSPARLLIHELTHAIYKGKGRLIVERGVKNLTDEEKQQIRDKYFKGKDFDFVEYADELNAHYTEALLDDDVLLQKLCDENPTLQDKIVAFLTGAKKAYADEPTLSREAKKLYKRYKTLFDSFAEGNQYNTVTSINAKKVQDNSERFAKSDNKKTKVIHGYTLNKNAEVNEDLLEELRIYDPNAEVSAEGNITVYHRTSEQSAVNILKTGIMKAKEGALFFSSKKEGYASDYGKAVLTFKIPSTKLRINDIFDGEVHFDMPLKYTSNGWSANVKSFLFDASERYALPDEVVEKVNASWYNEVSLPSSEYSRIESEALTWDVNNKNQIRRRTLSNEITYRYIIDDDNIVHVIDRTTSKNIHEWRDTYGDQSAKRPDDAIKELGLEYGRHGSGVGTTENGREQAKNDRSNNNPIRQQGNGDRTGNTKDRFNTYGGTETRIQGTNKSNRRKLVGFSENTDGTVTYEYSDKTIEVKDEDGNVIYSGKKSGYKKTSSSRFALPDGVEVESDAADTIDNVGKKKKVYKETFAQKFFTAKDSAYIELVDEMYGIAKYLKRIGRVKEADGLIQGIRSSISSAQTMIGDVQYDVFGDNKRLGDGLAKIVKPLKARGDKIYLEFNKYLMHWLNVDRMSLNKRSLAELADLQSNLEDEITKLREVNGKIAQAKDKKKSMFSDEVAKENLDKKIEELEKQRKALVKSVRDFKKQIDSFEVMENKPVFGENESRSEAVTAEQSLKIIEDMDKIHPDFKETAEKIWAYTKNLNHMRAQAGLISAESEAYMNGLYPHYVPAYRDFSYTGASAIKGKGNLAISSTVRRAKGGGQDILDVVDSIATQTKEVMRAGRINKLFVELYNTVKAQGDTEYAEIVGEQNVSPKESASMQADSIELKPKTNQITGFVGGKKVTIAVSREIFIAFESMGKPTVNPDNKIAVGLQKLNNFYKRLLTSWSPAFMLRNPIRDLQDAGLNSKHAKLFAKNLRRSARLMFSNSEEWQLYRANGGYSSSIFNEDGEVIAEIDKRGFAEMVELLDADASALNNAWNVIHNGSKNILTGIENANAFIEQLTRFTEFLASIESGDSVQTAVYNSAEVSTNFGRRGRTSKVLNATIMPFLNPSIQGFDKMIRNVTDAVSSDNVAKALGTLFVKAAAIGLAPMVLNMLLYGGDDDYEDLREEDKENNFLIKVGEGKFIKIPRGRVASVIGGAANRTAKLVKGEDADIKGYLSNLADQVTPVQNFTRTIFSPFFDAKNNLTWYGTAIEGREFDNTAPKDRYDENTSSIAIAIGKVTKWSPKKIHYVLDQYSGVIGDFVLPVTTSKAERDFFSGNFVIDAATSNKISAQFYEMYDKAQYARTAGDDTAIYQVKYLNKVKSAISEMYDEKSKVQNDKTLSSADKLQKTRTIQILINEAYKSAMADYELYTQAIGATQGIENTEAFKNMFGEAATEESIQKMRYTEAIHLMYGAERALKEYNSDVYEKSQLLNLAGLDYESIYQDYFSTKGITSDTDKQGKAISGSKRKKIVAAITAMKIPTEQKLLLIASKGYSLQDGDIRGMSGDTARKRLLNYILKLNVSKEQKIALAEMCGFEVKNGKIILKK